MNKKRVVLLLIFVCFIFSVFLSFGFKTEQSEIAEIKKRGVLNVGTTGDYCPMSCFNSETNTYVGFDIALAEDLAKSLGVKIKFIPTSWPALMQDVTDKKFDVAISGITITGERKKLALMSEGYLENGKTVLCRKEDAEKYKSLADINKPSVRVTENPGGLNEKFARENLPDANLIIHPVNYEIPGLIAAGKTDVMITEVIEADYYSHIYKELTAPLAEKPFTKGQIGLLLPKDNKSLLKYANKFIVKEQKTGRIDELKQKYIYSDKPLINHKR